jgi:polyisoprenoid-binding protein YceI
MKTLTLHHDHAVAAERWTLDPARTTIEFQARHLWGLSAVRGRFTRFEGTYATGPEGRPAIDLTIDADSIDTGNAARDRHLRSYDFFDVVEHPEVRFTSTDVSSADGYWRISGDLQVAGKRVPLVLDASVRQIGQDVELEATTTVDPRALGMSAAPLWSIRPPATLHVSACLVPAAAEGLAAA